MSLTSEQITEIVDKIDGIRTVVNGYDKVEIAQVSNALTDGDHHLTGAGTDTATSEGDTFILIVKGPKV